MFSSGVGGFFLSCFISIAFVFVVVVLFLFVFVVYLCVQSDEKWLDESGINGSGWKTPLILILIRHPGSWCNLEKIKSDTIWGHRTKRAVWKDQVRKEPHNTRRLQSLQANQHGEITKSQTRNISMRVQPGMTLSLWFCVCPVDTSQHDNTHWGKLFV